jgi:hypothetical protein
LIALSVQQPWAGLIAAGRKTVEVRTWRTNHRGPLLICAAVTPTKFRLASHISLDGIDLSVGVAVAVIDVVDCRPARGSLDRLSSCLAVFPRNTFAWVLANPRRIAPFSVRGQPGLFTVGWADSSDSAVAAIRPAPASDLNARPDPI